VSTPNDGKASRLLELCRQRGLKLATAESCTGGLIIGRLTDIAGSSDVVDRGFVTYSNAAKTEMIGVPAALIDRFGAVSEAVARAMAEGALTHSKADIAIAVTGIAGPGGATSGKPVGLVHFACARRGLETRHMRQVFPGDRIAIREATVDVALDMTRETAEAG
jgi:nicotinamide-nucleotide amidase